MLHMSIERFCGEISFSMNHQTNLKEVCRLCIQNLTEKRFKVNNVWIQEFIRSHFEESPDFSIENDTDFPKQICYACYMLMYNLKTTEEKHRKSQLKKSKDRRTQFFYSGTKVNIPSVMSARFVVKVRKLQYSTRNCQKDTRT